MLWMEYGPVIKIGPKGALGSHEIRPIHSAPSLGQSIETLYFNTTYELKGGVFPPISHKKNSKNEKKKDAKEFFEKFNFCGIGKSYYHQMTHIKLSMGIRIWEL